MKKTGCQMLDGVVIVPRRNGKSLPCKRLEEDNAKLVELLLKSFELMHRGGLTTVAYGPCMELFEEAEDIGVIAIVPFMRELGIEDE